MKNKKKKTNISVIMPVYNSEKYLSIAINSVLEQQHIDFELILVDDGSTDNSGKICDWYAAQDDRVRVVHQKNGGICKARNHGLRIAKGEYIAFCDDDDRYLPGLLSDNYQLIKGYNADIIRFRRIKITYRANGRRETSCNPLNQFMVLRGEEIGKGYFAIRDSFDAVWTGLYRTEMIRKYGICFHEQMRYGAEDAWFNLCCYEFADCIVLNPKVYYYWIQREKHSTTGKFHINLISSIMINIRKEWKVLEKRNVEQYCPDCYFIRLLDYLNMVVSYLMRENCTYTFLQKAHILREICLRIPDKSKIENGISKPRIRDAIKHNRGIVLYKLLKRTTWEW